MTLADLPPFADPIVIVDEVGSRASGDRRLALTPSPVLPRSAGGRIASLPRHSPPGTWAQASMPVTFTLAQPSSRVVVGVDAGDVRAELDVALRTWQLPACTAIRATLVETQAPVATIDDGVNVVVFHEDAWPLELSPGVVAQTVVHADASGHYRDADVHLNAAEFRFSLDGRDGTLDLRSVLVHELGHAFGLGHAEDPRATMHASGSGLRWRSLEESDVSGICTLYRTTPDAPPPPTCDRAPCLAPLVCVADRCQRPFARGDVCSPCASRLDCEAAGDDARCVVVGDGRACGRRCAVSADCGAGFVCAKTTEAGDPQCVSETACRNGASRCADDDACATSEGAFCAEGACLGPGDESARPDAGSPTAPSAPSAPLRASGGCAVLRPDVGATASRVVALMFFTIVVATAARRRRPRA